MTLFHTPQSHGKCTKTLYPQKHDCFPDLRQARQTLAQIELKDAERAASSNENEREYPKLLAIVAAAAASLRTAVFTAPCANDGLEAHVGSPSSAEEMGLVLSESDGLFRVEKVIAGGAAAESDLKSGDVVTEIQATQVRGKTLEQVHVLLAVAPGERVYIKYRSGVQVREAVLLSGGGSKNRKGTSVFKCRSHGPCKRCACRPLQTMCVSTLPTARVKRIVLFLTPSGCALDRRH